MSSHREQQGGRVRRSHLNASAAIGEDDDEIIPPPDATEHHLWLMSLLTADL